MIYVTNQGDTWDIIAKKTLGSEYLMHLLIDNNPAHNEIAIFPSGIEINIPDLEEESVIDTPPWLREEV